MPSAPTWARDAVIYHLYPLGLCGAPRHAPLDAAPEPRILQLLPWLDHAAGLGCTAVQLGPVFDSEEHGYDTIDLRRVDRRLGTEADLRRVCDHAHALGLRVIFDAVFNHVGRAHAAFQALLRDGREASTVGWFRGVNFDQRSPAGDPFSYEAWAGHASLVKLDVQHPEVRAHLLDTVDYWMDTFGVDGLRIDAADVLDRRFLRALRKHTDARREDFWLCGEVVHGDYSKWVSPQRLHSVTSYQAYKALWSSHVDRNYWELAHCLDTQFGPDGTYREMDLLSFADNHDQPRVASRLTEDAHLYPLHVALFTMPGIPSIYYGSEWGVLGVSSGDHDWDLRPALALDPSAHPHPDLATTIRRLTAVRAELPALRQGAYRTLHKANGQLAFLRASGEQEVVVVLNNADQAKQVRVKLGGTWRDALEADATLSAHGGSLTIAVPRYWGRILVRVD